MADEGAGAEPAWLAGIKGDESRRLIESESPVIKVLAGPGAGKTTCLIRRALRLTEQGKARRREIFVGTFTRVIAKSLHASFAKPETVEVKDRDAPVVSTLHSHASRLLREHPHAIGGRKTRFLLEHEETTMLYDIADKVPQFATHDDRRDELNKLQASWAQRNSLDDARFEGAVHDWLIAHGAMLVGEVVHLAANAIQQGDLEPKKFKHVFIDEFQDLTECEQAFVDFIIAGDGSIVALGDDDQSIYGFRYNHPEGIAAFPTDGKRKTSLEQIPLPDNYRCAKEIVRLANQIAAAAGSAKDPMEAKVAEEGSVAYVNWDSLDDEIEGLARVIKARKDNILVLVPRQFIGYRLANLIGADAVTTFREDVLAIPFVRERFMLATLLSNEDEPASLRAWLALDRASPKMASHRNVAAYQSMMQTGRRGLDLLQGIVDGTVAVAGMGAANVRDRAKAYLDWKADAPGDLRELIERLFDPTQADTMPGRHVPQNETAGEKATRERLERQDREKAHADLDLLKRAALRILDGLDEPDLESIMDAVRYRIGTRAPLLDDDALPRVRIMTLHGAKGLEEDTVVVAGLADEIIPGPGESDPAENAAHVAEQRRLLYVAVTRARRELVLSRARSIASADVHANGIRANGGFPTARGYYRRLTRTALLPATGRPPTAGSDWVKAQEKAIE